MAVSTIKLPTQRQKEYGQLVSIINNTESNKYECPMDGMVEITVNYRAGAYLVIKVSNSNGTRERQFSTYTTGIANSIMTVPVFKGQKVWVIENNKGTQTGGTNYLHFIPFADKN